MDEQENVKFVCKPVEIEYNKYLPKELTDADIITNLEHNPNAKDKKGHDDDNMPFKGYPCYACESTYTTYLCFSKSSNKNRINPDERYMSFECCARKLAKNPVPCLLCPVCRHVRPLTQRIVHTCDDGTEYNIGLGKKCQFCPYVCQAACECKVCNVLPIRQHPEKFHVIINDPEVKKKARSEYAKKVKEIEDEKVAARNQFINVAENLSAPLRRIATDPEGDKIFGELQYASPNALEFLERKFKKKSRCQS